MGMVIEYFKKDYFIIKYDLSNINAMCNIHELCSEFIWFSLALPWHCTPVTLGKIHIRDVNSF
jgi:hypothetical protein